MRKRKSIQLKDEEAEVNRKNGSRATRQHTTKYRKLFRELVDLIRNAEQSRTHCDSPDLLS
jgi:hypothetical protein